MKKIEAQNEELRVRRMFEMLEGAKKKERKRRVPPPLEPLPDHLIPRGLVADMRIVPPVV